MQQMVLTFGENGKPVLKENIGIYFNLSHSGRYVAGVFRTVKWELMWNRSGKDRWKWQNIFSVRRNIWHYKRENEKADCYFTELWTRKESYIKAVGKGIALDLASFCVLQDQVKFLKAGQTGEWYLQSYDPASGYILSVCAKKCTKCEIQWISKEMFTQKFIWRKTGKNL